MLKPQLSGLLIQKAFTTPLQYLVKNGFTRTQAHRILNNSLKSINYQLLERLCLLLRCTPNDLLV